MRAGTPGASWTPRRRGARETNGTPPRAEFKRFTREYGEQRNDNITVTGSEESTRFEVASGNEGRGTTFDELVGLILNLTETITQQTSLIKKQNNTIEVIRADLTDIKEEQQNLSRQNAELQERVDSLQSQVSATTAPPPLTRSWVSVAGY